MAAGDIKTLCVFYAILSRLYPLSYSSSPNTKNLLKFFQLVFNIEKGTTIDDNTSKGLGIPGRQNASVETSGLFVFFSNRRGYCGGLMLYQQVATPSMFQYLELKSIFYIKPKSYNMEILIIV